MNVRSWSVYLVTDPVFLAPGLDVPAVVQRACAADVSVVQYRDKDCSRDEFLRIGSVLRRITRQYGVPFIINDRVPEAVELGADGVHVGQDDMPVIAVRRLVGDDAIIGVSVVDVAQAVMAWQSGATYVAVNGVFPTCTKVLPEGELPGLKMVNAISRAVPLPVIGIGGINVSNAASVISAGAAGVAVVTAIQMRPDIEVAVAQLKTATIELG